MTRKIIEIFKARENDVKYDLNKSDIIIKKVYELFINGKWDFYVFYKNTYNDNILRHKAIDPKLNISPGRPKGSGNKTINKQLLKHQLEFYTNELQRIIEEKNKAENLVAEIKTKLQI